MLKLALTAALIVLVPMLAVADDKIIGAQPFTAMEISTNIDAVVEAGGETAIMARGDAEALGRLRTEFKDGVFRAWIDKDLLSFLDFGQHRVTLEIGVAQLDKMTASAGASIAITSWSGDALSADASSGASIKALDASGKSFTLTASSGASLETSGKCDSASAESSSGATVSAKSLRCADVKARASSGAGLSIGASKTLDAEVSSGAGITIAGKPSVTHLAASSGGNVSFE
jgi:hypothetical protein